MCVLSVFISTLFVHAADVQAQKIMPTNNGDADSANRQRDSTTRTSKDATTAPAVVAVAACCRVYFLFFISALLRRWVWLVLAYSQKASEINQNQHECRKRTPAPAVPAIDADVFLLYFCCVRPCGVVCSMYCSTTMLRDRNIGLITATKARDCFQTRIISLRQISTKLE